ncbi:MAG: flagellar hook basal-body protein [Syntrophorhabdaceae bacterium]|nr:flagellar hook basal-body protein [Syntrophorhabdaceae bacterium]
MTVAGKFVNEKRLDIIANNLANAQTAGFKASRPIFAMISTTQDENGQQGLLKNAYVNLSDTYIDFSDASIVESGAKLDMAILGPGFFSVSTPEGVQYTRNGQFMLDKSGRLVTMSGDPVMGKGGDITINVTDGKEILIETDGSIYLGKDLVDTIKVVEFKDLKGLKPVGKSNFSYSGTEAGEAPKLYTIRQGSFETSNVNVVREMVELIHTMRAYECYTKIDQMFSDANSKLTELAKF